MIFTLRDLGKCIRRGQYHLADSVRHQPGGSQAVRAVRGLKGLDPGSHVRVARACIWGQAIKLDW